MERVHRFEHLRSRHKIKQLLWLSTIKVIESLPSPTHTGCIGGSQSLPMPTSSSVPEMLVKVSNLTICRTSSPGTRLSLRKSAYSSLSTTTASSARSPAYSYLDRDLGCKQLFLAVASARPKYHIFGHVHEEGLQRKAMLGGTTFLNVSYFEELRKNR